MTEKNTEALSALLDFYSDRATAHASYFVAVTFGLFAILGIAQNEGGAYKQGTLCALSWITWLSGLYCLLNFGFFASSAALIKSATVGDVNLPFEEFRECKDGEWLPRPTHELSAKDIDRGIYDYLFLGWGSSLMRWLFRQIKGLPKPTRAHLNRKSEHEAIANVITARLDPINLVYWLIFALGSTAVFGWGGAYFWNFILLFAPLGFLLEDSFRLYGRHRKRVLGKIYCVYCGAENSIHANFCHNCGKKTAEL